MKVTVQELGKDRSVDVMKILKLKGPRTVLIAIKVMKCHFFPNFQTAPQANQNMLFTT